MEKKRGSLTDSKSSSPFCRCAGEGEKNQEMYDESKCWLRAECIDYCKNENPPVSCELGFAGSHVTHASALSRC